MGAAERVGSVRVAEHEALLAGGRRQVERGAPQGVDALGRHDDRQVAERVDEVVRRRVGLGQRVERRSYVYSTPCTPVTSMRRPRLSGSSSCARSSRILSRAGSVTINTMRSGYRPPSCFSRRHRSRGSWQVRGAEIAEGDGPNASRHRYCPGHAFVLDGDALHLAQQPACSRVRDGVALLAVGFVMFVTPGPGIGSSWPASPSWRPRPRGPSTCSTKPSSRRPRPGSRPSGCPGSRT